MQDINLQQLQQLVNYVAETIGEKCKYKATINPRLKRYSAIAKTYHYATTGRRRIDFNKWSIENRNRDSIIKLIIHEISHFKQSKTQKLRKHFLKYGCLAYCKSYRKHYHTKAFNKLVSRLGQKFEENKK